MNQYLFIREYSYDDVQLIPKKCLVDSRSECDTTIKFGNKTFDLPIVPANMKTIVDEKLCILLAQKNLFYVMHRFDVDVFQFCKNMKDKGLYISISVGVNEDSYELLNKLKEEKICPDYITIDIALGNSEKMKKMIAFIKDSFKTNSFVIAGNVATSEDVMTLENWGADCIKIGISNGMACTTFQNTGFGRPQVSTIIDCCTVAKKPIIADGGIRYYGDIAKAITLGANMVMAGGLFAGHEESPGRMIEINGKLMKEYFGSASKYNKDEYRNIEGRQIMIDFKGSIFRTYKEIKENLQSSISYSGGKNLSSLSTVDYVIVK